MVILLMDERPPSYLCRSSPTEYYHITWIYTPWIKTMLDNLQQRTTPTTPYPTCTECVLVQYLCSSVSIRCIFFGCSKANPNQFCHTRNSRVLVLWTIPFVVSLVLAYFGGCIVVVWSALTVHCWSSFGCCSVGYIFG